MTINDVNQWTAILNNRNPKITLNKWFLEIYAIGL